MSPFIWLVIGWVIGVFTARILEPISHLLGTIYKAPPVFLDTD